jgi:hypothetical protein
MPSVNVTIRHARTAIHLVLSGALRDIEAAFGDDDLSIDQLKHATQDLFDEALDQMSQWEISGSRLARMEEMVEQMGSELGRPDCPTAIRELLAEFHLEP